ncbi:threonine-phosphate decarboxylase CobD [Bosea sp. (in: a-proteobacteria)]|uniref:threonine-phosphate decarboxylase CobD n=1 Tax=Bosea sp. (in: a-proteobacteria) TaxID=1871050 RepID=UPI00261B9445|nr:threonine-phosphate decarboxylase CobD [Bosea sp. (in: a-proteobacteria)]MCO5090644.1 threonine-phosphate decarboxylase CobD [Bosea sp. (in: a-proteobacteria)]
MRVAVEEDIWHGGDLATARALFPEAPQPWIDLSTGINPIPYPLPALPLSLWTRLPGADDEAALAAAARAAYRVPDHAAIVAAPGTQILIELLPRLAPAGPVAVLGPTYAEHGHAWRKAGFAVEEAAAVPEAAATVVVVNPNNPDGRVMPREDLKRLARRSAARGGLVVVDEAFADFTPDLSIVPELPEATIVLRSFGKSYGLAGLRLGFAIAAPEQAAKLTAALGPWSVAGPALHVGALALADRRWLAAAGEARAGDAARLDALIAPHGRIIGGTGLFRLVETPAAPALFARLGRHGIYVRRFRDAPRRLRFGLPGDARAWARLGAALAADAA